MIPTAVAKAAIILKTAKMMVEVLIDLAADSVNPLRGNVWFAFVADWNIPFPDTLIPLF